MSRRRIAGLLLPPINLAVALALSGAVVALAGADPARALTALVAGAFGSGEAVGYTLYYATSFAFTGLAVAIAFHAGLFNIGAEGQAYVGGLGAGLICLAAGGWPAWLAVPVAVAAAAAFGAAWALGPAWIEARRPGHAVITTIMFNFIASSAMTWLLVDVLIRPGQQSPETREFARSAWMPELRGALVPLGWDPGHSPLNLSSVLALAAGVLAWCYLWRTRWGYELRAAGHSEAAAAYAGISRARTVLVALCASGALAGLMSVNEVMGGQHRLALNFVGGAGYIGIAVALMGRNHPAGIALAAVLFGALYQGGAEISLEVPRLTRDVVVVIQGLVILVCGALEHALRRPVGALLRRAAAPGA